jgi:hypothetical protein
MRILIGTVSLRGGVMLTPSDRLFVHNGHIFYLSMGADFSWRLGAGNVYDAWDHSFTFSIPFLLHRKIDERNEGFAGFGYSYSYDLLYTKKPYEDPQLEKYGALGLFLDLGYRFEFREKMLFFLENRIDIRFYNEAMISFSLNAGIDWRIHTQEVKKTW